MRVKFLEMVFSEILRTRASVANELKFLIRVKLILLSFCQMHFPNILQTLRFNLVLSTISFLGWHTLCLKSLAD